MSATHAVPQAASLWGSGPLLLWILLIVLIVLLVALGIFLFWQVRRRRKPDQEKDKDATASDSPVAVADMPGSFEGALHELRARGAGRDFRYCIPWYLLMGPEGSGKRSMLSDSTLSSLLEERVGVEHSRGLAWNFFGDGIVIHVGGWCVQNTHSAGTAWQRLLRLFVSHRPQRPLDGIVLAVSAKDLTGAEALSPEALMTCAATLQQRLRQLTQTVGFRLPLYFVLTHCDAIAGFPEFCSELENEELDQIFGWSNPYGEDLQFQPEWMSEAVNAMRVSVEQTQARLFAANEYSPKREAMFLFPGALYKLIPVLQLLLSRTMRGSGDVPAPMFRGIYCTGATDTVLEASSTAHEMVPVSRPGLSTRGFLNQIEENDAVLSWVPKMLEPWLRSNLRIAFVHDLFLKKIFPEKGIGAPLGRTFAARSRWRLSLQMASGVTALVLIIGTSLAYHRLHTEWVRLEPLLFSIETDLQTPPHFSVAENIKAHPGAEDLIHAMASFSRSGFHSLFLPASWLARENAQIRNAMVSAFRVLVLQRFHDGLVERSKEVASLNSVPLPEAQLPAVEGNAQPVTQLQRLPEYLQMAGFLQMVGELDKNIAIYNRLSMRGDSTPLASIIGLDEYLHHRSRPIPVEETSNSYFAQAITEATWPLYEYDALSRQQMTAKAQQLTGALYNAWIANNVTRTYTDRLAAGIVQLSAAGPHSLPELTVLKQGFHDAAQIYGAPNLRWVADDDFQMPPSLAAVTTSAANISPFFQPWLHDWMVDVGDQDFRVLSEALDSASTPLTGRILEIDDGQMGLSDNAQQMQSAIESLLNLPFISAATASVDAEMPGDVRHIVWDKASIAAAAKLPVVYEKYQTEDLSEASMPVRNTLGRIASAQAARAIEVAILEAQHPSFETLDAVQAALSFSDAAPVLGALMETLQQYGMSAPLTQLRQITLRQASALLLDLDRKLDEQAPYGVATAVFNTWTSGTPTNAIFDAGTADALAAYLGAQHDQIVTLNAAANPLVHFLSSYRNALSPAASRSLARWEGIGAALDQYQQKKPGNSVGALEKFVSSGMDTILPSDRCSTSNAVLPSAKRVDYFLLAAQRLQQETALRCGEILHENFYVIYRQLAMRFNHELAGQFPFAAVSASSSTEADPVIVANVYRIPDTVASLLRSADADHAPAAVQSFLDEMSGTRPWFASILTTSAIGGTPGVDILPQFRVSREQEIGGDQIIDWSLTVGDQTLHAGDAPAKMHWNYGDAVTFSLRWAKDAPFVPQKMTPAIDNSAVPRSNQETVSWQFTDPWALLRFVRTFDASATTTEQLQPFTLRFAIPETAASSPSAKLQSKSVSAARVFIRLQVFAAGQKDPVASSPFPFVAPELPSNIQTARGGTERGQE